MQLSFEGTEEREEITLMTNACLHLLSYRVSAQQIETFPPKLANHFMTVTSE